VPSFPGDLDDYASKDEPAIGGATGKVMSNDLFLEVYF